MLKLYFSDLIDIQSVNHLISALQQGLADSPDETELTLFISSGGGKVDIAIELYRFLINSGLKISTVNTSVVNSAANIIFLAGERRIAYPQSTFYIHSVAKKLRGTYTAKDLKKIYNELDTNTNILASLMAKHTLRSKSYWMKLMNTGKILTSKEALKIGLATIEYE